MGHLVVFLNFAILGIGLAIAAAFLRLYRSWPTPAAFWQTALFWAFSLTMAAAAISSYVIVNLGFEPFESRLLASLVLAGSAAMLFMLPHNAHCRAGLPRPRRFSLLWGGAALLTLGGAAAQLLLGSNATAIVVIAVAFVPFFAAILYSLSVDTRHHASRAAASWIALFLLCVVAAVEIGWTLTHPPERGAFLVTLPLAYLYFCWSAWRERVRPEPGDTAEPWNLELPQILAQELGLTEREREIAELILKGRANKELAGDLRISENTVRNHIYNLYRKLGIQKRLDLVLLVRKYQGKSGLSGS